MLVALRREDRLAHGSSRRVVVDWQDVPTFGFSDPGHRHDFQIWIGINGDAHPDEDVTIGYGDIGIASTDGLNAGAEIATARAAST